MSRRSLKAAMLVLLALLAGLVAVNLLVAPPQPQAPVEHRVRLAALAGQVEFRRAGRGAWQPARLDVELAAHDEIRTGLFSEATLVVGDADSVVIGPNSSFVVGADFVKHSNFELAAGKLRAAISAGDQREYRFRARSSDAVAATRQGLFDLATDGKGTVVVDTHRGEVEVAAAGRKVKLRRGTRSMVRPGSGPSPALPIPKSVALQVKWPPGKLDRTSATVSGRTAAGALVMVNGLAVYAGADGSFRVRVPLRQGDNRLVVSATDASGRTVQRRSGKIQVDTRPPKVQVDAKDLWK